MKTYQNINILLQNIWGTIKAGCVLKCIMTDWVDVFGVTDVHNSSQCRGKYCGGFDDTHNCRSLSWQEYIQQKKVGAGRIIANIAGI